MSHPRFEAMLFEREDLEASERLALEQHLQECDTCCRIASNWAAIETQLRKPPMMEPMPGFTLRFQKRLTRERNRRRRWATAGVLSTTFVSLLIVVVLFGSGLLSLLSPGVVYLLKSLSSLILFSGVMQIFTDFISLLVERLAVRVSPSAWMGYSAVFSMLVIIWFASIYKLNIRRSFQEVGQ